MCGNFFYWEYSAGGSSRPSDVSEITVPMRIALKTVIKARVMFTLHFGATVTMKQNRSNQR